MRGRLVETWATAASGHAAAAPPSSVMNSRRSHSITSSARPSSGSGTVRPSALAVLRLMMSLNLSARWTGRSAGLRALEDAIDVRGRLPEVIDQVDIGAVVHEAAIVGEIRLRGDRRQAITAGQVGDQLLTQPGEAVGRQDQPAVRFTREALQGGFDIGSGANGNNNRLHAEGRRSGLDRTHEEFRLRRCVGVEDDRDPREAGHNLLEQVNPFSADRELVHAEAREVAARFRHAPNEALRNGIGDLHEDDRDGAGGLLDDGQVRRGRGQDHVWHQPDQLRRVGPRKCGIAGVPANIDPEILAFGPSQLAESSMNVATYDWGLVSVAAAFISTPIRRTRSPAAHLPQAATRRRTSEQRDELPTFQSIELHLLPQPGTSWQHTALARIKLGAHCTAGFPSCLCRARGHTRTTSFAVACPLPPGADMVVGQAAQFLLGICPCRQPNRED